MHERAALVPDGLFAAERQGLRQATETLDAVVAEIRACRICRDTPSSRPLPHEPRPIFVASDRAPILIASQAPGIRAHVSGVPFMDPSGIRLRQWLGVGEPTFYDPANFAILPMGFCFPGHDAAKGDLPPRRECAPVWQRRTLALMPQVELILVIGTHSHQFHLGKGPSMTETVRDWRTILAGSDRPMVLPLPHPSWRNSSWLKRNPWFDAELVPELQALVRRLIAPMA